MQWRESLQPPCSAGAFRSSSLLSASINSVPSILTEILLDTQQWVPAEIE